MESEMLQRSEMLGVVVVMPRGATARLVAKGLRESGAFDGTKALLSEVCETEGTWELRYVIWDRDFAERDRDRALGHPHVGRMIVEGLATKATAEEFDRRVREHLA
jgi:hypothetical protein